MSSNPFDPQSMYTHRNLHNPYRTWESPRGPRARPSLQAANISPQASITAAEQPNVGRTTGSLYDFTKNAPTDNSELFNTDVSGQRARERMSG